MEIIQAPQKLWKRGLSISRDIGDRLTQATALNDLGAVRKLTGDYRSAVRLSEEALDIYRNLGNQLGQANALLFLSDARSGLGITRNIVHMAEEAWIFIAILVIDLAKPTL